MGLPLSAWAGAQKVFLNDDSTSQVSSVETDALGFAAIINNSGSSIDSTLLAIDSSARKLYYFNVTASSGDMFSANLDGTNQTFLFSVVGAPSGLSLDLVNQKFYWGQNNSLATIQSANLDGSSQQTVSSSFGAMDSVGEIQYDPADGSIFYVVLGLSGNRIERFSPTSILGPITIANLSSSLPYAGLALDSTHGKVYWSEPSANTVTRANLDGSSPETVISSDLGLSPEGLAIDPSSGPTLYFTDAQGGFVFGQDTRQTAPAGISVLATPLNGLVTPKHLALLLPITLSPGTQLTDPPEIRVDVSTKTVTFILQPFDGSTLTSAFQAASLLQKVEGLNAQASTTFRYDVTVTRSSDGLVRRLITKNAKASLQLPVGTYVASYKALIVKTRAAASKKNLLAKINATLASLKKKKKTTSVLNKIEAQKANKQLAGVTTVRKTNQSPDTAPFAIS